MRSPKGITRVVVVVMDGLRADAIPLFQLPNLQVLMARGSATLSAQTVAPSITTAALTSLLTGVAPRRHGLASDRIVLPGPRSGLIALPRWLADHGIPTFGFRGALPWAFRGVAHRIVMRLGASVTFAGERADAILTRALPSLRSEPAGLWICHWPDADLAGHASGWTSREYRCAAEEYDRVLGRLLAATGVADDSGTVLVVLADHGGGGRVDRHHASGHPLDTTIPLILAGGQIAAGALAPGSSLLDVPATVPWLLGLPTPPSYEGRVLVESIGASAAPGPGIEVAA